MATACWSSLPLDLIHCIAGRLHAAADLDCYMAFRAVCHNWRSATADPCNTLDHRFRPHGWVMLDYPYHDEEDDSLVLNNEDARLMLNTATGRFHVKNMPLLRKYYVVAVTAYGLLVLPGHDVPHLACVLNPFTGHMVHFAARMMRFVGAAAVSGSSPPHLVLYCNDSMKLYRASPATESFVRYKKKYAYPLVRKVVQGCVAMDGHENVLLPPLPAAVVTKIADMMTAFVPEIPSEDNVASRKRCFLVESAGETLVVFKLENGIEVFKVEMGGNALERVHSIGSRDLFIGGWQRCLSLDADKFPSVEANCVYLVDRSCSPSIGMYHLKESRTGNKVAESQAPVKTHLLWTSLLLFLIL